MEDCGMTASGTGSDALARCRGALSPVPLSPGPSAGTDRAGLQTYSMLDDATSTKLANCLQSRIKAESTSKVEGWGNDMSSSSTSPDMSVTISLFLKTGTSIQDHLHGITERHQP
uniref:Uncharacterized protein n=1 Tax=Knipowitschia caucasica TaxID=637954 RepID=A0AAV2JGF6_KNICA